MRRVVLYLTAAFVSTCGIVYELVAGALSTYMLGDSVTQLSLVIGTHLSFMGLGAWLSKYVKEQVADRAIDCQLAASLVGGLTGPLLYAAFASTSHLRVVLYALVATTAVFIGAEVPLLMRVLRRRMGAEHVVASVLSFDYVGALVGGLLFSLVLLPKLGSLRTGIAFGLVGVGSAFWAIGALGMALDPKPLYRRSVAVLAVLAVAFAGAPTLVRAAEEALFLHPVVFSKQTAYQRISITEARSGTSLWLDGNLQFASNDEYRYHEALVHPAFAVAERHRRVLVLGGGDGLAVREILRYGDVDDVTLVDLDPAMTTLARELPVLRDLNGGSLSDRRVHVVNDDAMVWLARRSGNGSEVPEADRFDVVLVDFPDPNNFSLGKLYTVRFYRMLRAQLAAGAAIAVQSTSPLAARRAYWCIVRTMEEAGLVVRPYHALVPSFGEWGFVLAGLRELPVPTRVLGGLRYLTSENVSGLFVFPPDMGPVAVEPNRLNNQLLVRYYEEEWRRYVH